MHQGYVKLYRKFTEWGWWDDHNTTRLFIYLLTAANYKKNVWKGVEVKAGQVITGRKKLSEKTGLSEQNIRTALKNLISTSEITINSHSKYSLITITKWSEYQSDNQQPNQHLTNNQPASNQQSTTNKKDKNYKKIRNKEIPPTPSEGELSNNFSKTEPNHEAEFDEIFWPKYPHKTGKPVALRAFIKARKRASLEEIIPGLDRYIAGKPDEQPWLNPSTFLNQDRWADQPAVTSQGARQNGVGWIIPHGCDEYVRWRAHYKKNNSAEFYKWPDTPGHKARAPDRWPQRF